MIATRTATTRRERIPDGSAPWEEWLRRLTRLTAPAAGRVRTPGAQGAPDAVEGIFLRDSKSRERKIADTVQVVQALDDRGERFHDSFLLRARLIVQGHDRLLGLVPDDLRVGFDPVHARRALIVCLRLGVTHVLRRRLPGIRDVVDCFAGLLGVLNELDEVREEFG